MASTVGDEALRYQIEVDDLNDDDVRRICELYWMDYICMFRSCLYFCVDALRSCYVL